MSWLLFWQVLGLMLFGSLCINWIVTVKHNGTMEEIRENNFPTQPDKKIKATAEDVR